MLIVNRVNYDGSPSQFSESNILDDPYFKPYLHQIRFCYVTASSNAVAPELRCYSNDVNLPKFSINESVEEVKQKHKLKEKIMLQTGRFHLASAYSFLFQECQSQDVIISTDCDESLDLSNRNKRGHILNHLIECSRSQSPVRILRHKYEYDFFNSWPTESYAPTREWGTRWICAYPFSLLQSQGNGNLLWDGRGMLHKALVHQNLSLGLEYTSCLSIEDLLEKGNKSEHGGDFTAYDIKMSLLTNSSLIMSSVYLYSEYIAALKQANCFSILDPSSERSCQYVLENANRLATNSVSKDYRQARIRLANL